MSASLIYYWRRGLLAAVAAGKTFHVATHQTETAIQDWEKVQEIRTGRVTLWDHCFETPPISGHPIGAARPAGAVIHRIGIESSDVDKLDVYDYPGEHAQRFDSSSPTASRALHPHAGGMVYVGGKRRGICLHGWPPCELRTCIFVKQQWDELFRAVAEEKELRFSIDRS